MSEQKSLARDDDSTGAEPALRPGVASPVVRSAGLQPWDFAAIHPDPETAREVVIDTLLGALAEAAGGLERALDFNAATPQGLAIKHDVRHALANAEKALAWRAPGPERWATPPSHCPSCGAAGQPTGGECSKCGNHCFPRR